jgi:hypothetical protein
MRRTLIFAFALLAACGAAPSDELDDNEEPGDEPAEGKFDGPGTKAGTTLVLRGTVLTMDETLGANDVLEGGAVVPAQEPGMFTQITK